MSDNLEHDPQIRETIHIQRITDALMIRLTLIQQNPSCLRSQCDDACTVCAANLDAADTAAGLIRWALVAWCNPAERGHACDAVGEAERSLYAVGGHGLAWEMFGRQLMRPVDELRADGVALP